MSSSLSIEVHPSQHPAASRARLLAAVEAGRLPARFLYDSPAQAARWLAYHAAWSPSRTEASLLALYDRAFELALDAVPGSELAYVSLGCGGGTKDARFLARARGRGRGVDAVLTDTSPSLVVEAMLRSPGVRGLVVDLDVEPGRDAFVRIGERGRGRPVVLTAFGMVPNLEHRRFLSWLAGLLGPEDRALVSANLHPRPWPAAGPAILPQYDNPEARAWYAGALAELGLERAELRIAGRETSDDGGAWRVEVTARVPRPTEVRVFDLVHVLPAGVPLSVFFSNRFTPAAFVAELGRSGLEVEAELLFDGEEEGIWLVSPGSRRR